MCGYVRVRKDFLRLPFECEWENILGNKEILFFWNSEYSQLFKQSFLIKILLERIELRDNVAPTRTHL